ncbi:MAG: alanine racemase, partial [Chlorobia bacterium]|nr:alanine racemase [Fimbriimonadaceae bacterium]
THTPDKWPPLDEVGSANQRGRAVRGRVKITTQEIHQLRSEWALDAIVIEMVFVLGWLLGGAAGAELAIYDRERLGWIQQAADRLGIRAKVHLKIDALLGRQGLLPDDIPEFLAELKRHPSIELVAAYSHFANIEDTTDLTHAHAQTAEFERGFAVLDGFLERHESATSGAMVAEGLSSPNQWVRLGIGLYGLYPSTQLERTWSNLQLRPAIRWVSHLAQVKSLPAKHPVGYGLTYITSKKTKIGIVPQGYSDGYDRGLSNTGEVLVAEKRCPVLGRIAMNMFAIDLSLVPEAQPEDEVVLLGAQGEDRISAEEIALKTGTINYEVVARISPLLPRVFA